MMIKDQILQIKKIIDESYLNLQMLEYSIDIESYVRFKLDTITKSSKELLEFVNINSVQKKNKQINAQKKGHKK